MMMDGNYGHWDTAQFGEFDPNEFFGFIYEIEELATGRSYIGKKFFRHKRTKTKANKSKFKESDWKEYTSSCEPLKESIALQGKDKFTFRILSLCAGRSQLTYEECQYQYTRDVLRTKLPNGERKYFNRTIGHLLFAGVEKQSDEARAKISAGLAGNSNRLGVTGYRCTEETKVLISTANKGNTSALGHKLTNETKVFLSALRTSQKGAKRGPYKNKARFCRNRKKRKDFKGFCPLSSYPTD